MTTKKTSAVSRNVPVVTQANVKQSEPEAPLRPVEQQMRTWEKAMELFSGRKYAEAAELFREVETGPAVHMKDKARSYGEICNRKTARNTVEFKTAEDNFYYGVERLNAGDLGQANLYLTRALRLQPDGDHILYTLALCCGMGGDGNAACENLKLAIELEPRNRIMARQDSEFAALAEQYPALRGLLGSNSGA